MMDPWEYQLIKGLDGAQKVPWTDEQGCRHHGLSWVADKLEVSLRYNGKKSAWLYDLKDGEWFVRPRFNPDGLSKAAGIVRNECDYSMLRRHYDGALMAQPVFKGTQYSIDLVLDKGKVIDRVVFVAHKDGAGSFTEFERVNDGPLQRARKVAESLSIRRGIVNVELIDEKVIEIHLRPSVQFADIDGGLVSQYPAFLTDPSYEWRPCHYEPAYSKVFRKRVNLVPRLKGELPRKWKNVRSYQLCLDFGHPLGDFTQDPFSYRWAVVNCKDRVAGSGFARALDEAIEWKPA